MSTIDLTSLLAPVSADNPCGEDLANERLLLDAEVQPRPDPEDSERSLPPDWVKIRRLSEEHLGQSKDLKVAVVLLQSLMETEGLAGLGDGLSLLRELLEQYWDGLYPSIDEDGDAFERVMALQPLNDSYVDGQDASDSLGMVAFSFRRMPLVRLQGLGEYTLRDYKLAHRQWRFFVRTDLTPLAASQLDGAFKNCPLEELQTTGQLLEQAETDLVAMEMFLGQRVSEDVPTFQQLLREIRDARAVVDGFLKSRGGIRVANTLSSEDSVTELAHSGSSADQLSSVPGGAAPGEIHSRDDVLETLGRLCEYYEHNEPGSPVPLLLERAKRLVNMSFMELLNDLAPAGLDQAKMIQGSTGESGGADDQENTSSSW